MNATGKTRGRTGRIFKRIMLGLAILLILLAIFILSVIAIDASQTSYLDVDNYPKADLKSRLIINANVIPMTSDTILRNQMVLIEDGTIVKIADVIDTTGRTVFDAEQHYLTPGLVDMHVHVWDKYELGLYLSYGVTSIRNLWGRPEHLRIKKEVTNDEIFSP